MMPSAEDLEKEHLERWVGYKEEIENIRIHARMKAQNIYRSLGGA
jgi:hypothetical protein